MRSRAQHRLEADSELNGIAMQSDKRDPSKLVPLVFGNNKAENKNSPKRVPIPEESFTDIEEGVFYFEIKGRKRRKTSLCPETQ
jgi:hypothetical protein